MHRRIECKIQSRAVVTSFALSNAVPPKWIVEPEDQSAVLGNTVIISCEADGSPAPTISWKQAIGDPSDEYRDLGFSKADSIETYPNGTLIIQNVSQSHEGYFLCQAKNEIGAGLSKLIRLTVHGRLKYSVR